MVLLVVLNDKVEKLNKLVAVELDPESSIMDDMRSIIVPVEDTCPGDLNEMAVVG